jgi:hypothetical protein
MKFKLLLSFLLGIASYGFYNNFKNNLIDTQVKECEIQLKALVKHLDNFKKECGRLPTEKEGIDLLINPMIVNCKMMPSLHSSPIDPWNERIIYLIRENRAYLFSSQKECGYQTLKL